MFNLLNPYYLKWFSKMFNSIVKSLFFLKKIKYNNGGSKFQFVRIMDYILYP